MEIQKVKDENGYLLHIEVEPSPYTLGVSGVPAYSVAGWAYDTETEIMHFYERFNSVALCGHIGRPAESYTNVIELVTFYSNVEESCFYARLCPGCKKLKEESEEQNNANQTGRR